jgi:transaldolase
MIAEKAETLIHVFHEHESGSIEFGKAIRKLVDGGFSEESATRFMDNTAAMPEYALPFIRGFVSGFQKEAAI